VSGLMIVTDCSVIAWSMYIPTPQSPTMQVPLLLGMAPKLG